MAYSNWGAFVYHNGDRRPDREDVVVFAGIGESADVPSGVRIWKHLLEAKQAGTLADREPWDGMQHAVLGDGPVRLCGYKNYPRLFVARDDHVEIVEFRHDTKTTEHGTYSYLAPAQSGTVTVGEDEWKWQFQQDDNRISLVLHEPDGSMWSGTSGYAMGAGWDD